MDLRCALARPGFAAVLALLLAIVWTTRVAAGPHPNVLLIIADDYGTDSLSLYNNATTNLPPTPHINSLAANGVRFRNAYAYPTCSPSRCAILTGRYGFRTGIGSALTAAGDVQLPASEFTLPEALSANPALGCQHASIGKWHLSFTNTDPNTLGGWSHFSGSLRGALPDYSQWPKVVNGLLTPAYTVYATTDNVNDALAWISQRGTNSWFLWLAFNAGHTPFHKPPNSLHSYDSLPGTPASINANPRPYYEAMIEAMDTEIGRLLASVNLTNTIVLFLGDNGTPRQVIQPPYSSNHAKDTLYEGGVRVPLIIAGAGVANPGRISTNVVHCVDLFATILELAGVNLAQTLPADRAYDSQSLLPILNNTATNDPARCVLSESFGESIISSDSGRALRNDRYKLIQYSSGTNELYDLLADPLEATNLLAGTLTDAAQAALALLTAKSDEWQARPVISHGAWSAGTFTTTFTPVQHYTYTLERAAALTSPAWLEVTNALAPSSAAALTLTDPAATGTNRFYRLHVAMP